MADLRDLMRDVYDRHGSLTPAVVVEEATPEDAPLHNRFEWDDAVAGHKHRLDQARRLIRAVQIEYKTPTGGQGRVRAWTAVREPTGHVYKPTDEVVHDDIMTELLRRDMEREWRQMKSRWDRFEEFQRMVRADLAQEVA